MQMTFCKKPMRGETGDESEEIILSSLNHDFEPVNDIDARDCRFAVEPHAVERKPNVIINCRL